MTDKEDEDVLKIFYEKLSQSEELEPEIVVLVDKYFWDLI